jgi:hypothetical protein
MMRRLLALLLVLSPCAALAQTPAAVVVENTTQVAPVTVTQPVSPAANLPAVIAPGAPAVATTTTTTTTAITANSPQVILDSGAVLIKLFVLATILESALSFFFNWRPIARIFNRKGLKPVVSFITAAAFTLSFNSHLFATLFASYGYDTTYPGAVMMCQLLEAAVLAGGSSGVNRLLRNLGLRPIDPVAEQNPTPRPQEAWISVGLRRLKAVGDAQVEIATGIDPLAAQWQIAGQVSGHHPSGALARWLLQDPARFPQSGGHTLAPGVSYMIRLTGNDAAGAPIASTIWGPNALADRAVVDLEITL